MKTILLQHLFRLRLSRLCALGLGALLGIIAPDRVAAQRDPTNAPPDRLSYQGYLVDATGNALARTAPQNFTIVFRIWTAANDGTRLWSEQQVVTVDNGNFSVVLGDGAQYLSEARPPLGTVLANSDNASDRYIGINVTINGTPTEILPRLRLLPTPYSFLATSARNLTAANGNTVVSHANNRVEITGNLLASGTISGTFSGSGAGLNNISWSSLSEHIPGRRHFLDQLVIGSTASAGASVLVVRDSEIFPPFGLRSLARLDGHNPDGTYLTLFNSGQNRAWNLGVTGTGGFGQGGGKFIVWDDTSIDARIRLTIDTNGRIGIGTTGPQAMLHVAGTTVRSDGNGNFILYNFPDDGGTRKATSFGDVVGYFDGGVIASGSVASQENPTFSDIRAKTVLKRSSGAEDLVLLDQIQVTDFRWIDQARNSSSVQKKVIAQEVEQVLPNAVSRMAKAVPNVYQNASAVAYDAQQSQLTLTVNKAHDFQPGDQVDVFTDTGDLTKAEVLAVGSTNQFTIASKFPAKEAFVYGKWVEDYRVVDYDAIAMVNVSATQELHRKLRAQESEISALKLALAELQTSERLREVRTAALEKRVARMAQATSAVAAREEGSRQHAALAD